MKFLIKTRVERNQRELRRKHRLRTINRKIIREEKLKRGCELCGRHDVPAENLHFHHRDGKKKRRKISHMITSATDVLIDEISQCRLWCRWSHSHFHRTGEIKCCPEAWLHSGGGAL